MWNLREHGYKPEFDGYESHFSWWKDLFAFVAFLPVCIVRIIIDLWRYRR